MRVRAVPVKITIAPLYSHYTTRAFLTQSTDAVSEQNQAAVFKPPPGFVRQSFSTSESHSAADASLGIRQSPRGDRDTEPIFGPSGIQERLNCCAKKRL